MRKNKLRTFLTAMGVFWGIFMLMVLLGAGNGLSSGVQRQFGEGATNAIWIDNGKTSLAHGGLKPGRNIAFTNDDVKAIQSAVGDQIDVMAFRNFFWGEFTIYYKKKNGNFSTMGCNSDFFKISGDKLNQGRLINYKDVMERRKVIIIGERAKNVLFGEDFNPLGEYVEIKGAFYKVVGVFNATGGGNVRREERIYMPITTLQAVSNNLNSIHVFAITVRPGEDSHQVAEKIRALLAKRHNFSIKDEEAVEIYYNEEEYQKVMGLMAGIKIFVWIVGVMTLLAGVVGVSNIMLIIVKERTREIGVRKALGATPWSIISLILQESIVITAISGYLGMLAGIGLLELFRWGVSMAEESGGSLPYFTNPSVDLGVAIAANVVLVVAGAVAGLMPALKAANIKPIEALRAD